MASIIALREAPTPHLLRYRVREDYGCRPLGRRVELDVTSMSWTSGAFTG